MIPLLSPHYPWADLTCGGERDNNPRRTSGETLPSPFAAFELDPEDVAPQERPPVAGSHLIRLHGAGFRLQSQTASHTSPTGATAGASSACAPLRLLRFVRAFLRALGTRLSIGNTRVKFLQEPSRRFADLFHLTPFALTGLADALDGHQQIRRKMKCPTKALKGETR